jgi:predicted HTH transcriptional regulator
VNDKIKTLIQNDESITVEFKESKSNLNKDVYETVCAFLNRDDGTIVGVDANKVEEEVKYDLFGEYLFEDDNLHGEAQSKLIKDISQELGLIP